MRVHVSSKKQSEVMYSYLQTENRVIYIADMGGKFSDKKRGANSGESVDLLIKRFAQLWLPEKNVL